MAQTRTYDLPKLLLSLTNYAIFTGIEIQAVIFARFYIIWDPKYFKYILYKYT